MPRRRQRCAAGQGHSLFLLPTGDLWACGIGTDGELGVGDITEKLDDDFIPTPLPDRASHGVSCKAVHRAHRPVKVLFEDGIHARSVSAGDCNSYAISSLGDPYAWGRGRYGALGHDDGEQSHTLPTRLQGLKANTVNRIACGRWHCVALMSNDQLLTWGRNHCGQIGIGSVSRACTRPVLIELEPGGGRSPSVRDVASGIQLSE